MRMSGAGFFLASAMLVATAAASASEPVRVLPSDLHLDRLHPARLTYLVYMHDGPGTGIERPMLATIDVRRDQVDGVDAWVVEHHWEDESGQVHTARTVHASADAGTLSQTTTWSRPNRHYSATVLPAQGQGRIEGELAPDARQKMEAGFNTMQDGWWMNWHSDLTLLPLLPYEKGGTLRIRLFDVGMSAPIDGDYTVIGERVLQGGDGTAYDCWLVEKESGQAGSGNFQRFWIDKTRRLVVKEEDVFNGRYRSKVLLSVPAVTEFRLGSERSGTKSDTAPSSQAEQKRPDR